MRLYVSGAFVLVSVVIIIDFLFPGKVYQNEILEVKGGRQQYYNAARNSHFSYKVVTPEHEFSISEEQAGLELDHQKIEYSVSRIFKEVNWYKIESSKDKLTYSLRTISGLIVPLLSIISILIAKFYKRNISTLVFVLQVLLIADLIYVIK